MTFFGLLYCARALATQYGDGEALLEFWKESLYWYNRLGKVRNYSNHQLLPLQELQHCLNEKKPLLGSGLTGVITGGMSRWLTNTMLNCLLSCCCR